MDDRHSATSIYMMAMEAIRKAVMYHHTRLRPCQVEMQNGLKDAICAKIRDHPGGTLAIRARNVISDHEPALKTFVVYRLPAAPGSHREARETRRREAREKRREECRARGNNLHTLTFFSYDTDISEDDTMETEGSSVCAASARSSTGTRRKRRVRRSLIRRLSYYPPRAPETSQVVLDFMNLEMEGADFTPPLNKEEFQQTEEDGGGTSDGMESDFDETRDPPPRACVLPALNSATIESGADLENSPTTSTRNLVHSLSVTDSLPPTFNLPPLPHVDNGEAIWTLGLGSLNGATSIVPDADAAAAAMWQATEAAWDAVPALLPPVQPTTLSDEHLLSGSSFVATRDRERIPVLPALPDLDRFEEGAALIGNMGHYPRPWPPSSDTGEPLATDSVFHLTAAAASLQQRPETPPPALAPMRTPDQLRQLHEVCSAIITSGLSHDHVVGAYIAERVTPGSMTGYAHLHLPSEREAFHHLHTLIERALNIMNQRQTADSPLALATSSDQPPPASAPPTVPPLASSSARVNVINIPGLGIHRIEAGEGDLPATFTNRGRMKRQREARAASAAAIADAHAAAAAHAAREQQLFGEDALVAGPSAAFDHDRRKARRLVEDSTSTPCSAIATESTASVGAEDTSTTGQQPLQRVLGAVTQHPTSAAGASSASAHSLSCPCVYCPSGMTHRHRLGTSASLPPISTPILHMPMQQPSPISDMNTSGRMQASMMAHHLRLQSIALQQQLAQTMQPQQSFRNVLPFDMGAAIRAAVASPVLPTQAQALVEGNRLVHLSNIPNPQSPNGGPTLPRMDIPFYYPPMSFLSVSQPSAPMPPPSFVDLPEANQVMSRQHMFNPATTSLSTAAAAALAAAGTRSEQQPGGESIQQQHNDRMLAQLITLTEANREFHALLSAGIPPPGEAAPIGATQRDIEKHSVMLQWKANMDVDVDPCTVCMSEFQEGENVRELACHHLFHVHCIDPWLSYNKKCPNCRIDLDQRKIVAANTSSPILAPGTRPSESISETAAESHIRITQTLEEVQHRTLHEMMQREQNDAIASSAANAEERISVRFNSLLDAPTTDSAMGTGDL